MMAEKTHSSAGRASVLWNESGKPKSISARHMEFLRNPSSFRCHRDEIGGKLREFHEHMLKKNILLERKNRLVVWNQDSLQDFCTKNVLPLTTRFAEEGIYLGIDFESNIFLVSEIFHRVSFGGPGEDSSSLPPGRVCPVFFGTYTSSSHIIEKEGCPPPYIPLGSYDLQSACSEERICIFLDRLFDEAYCKCISGPPPLPKEPSLGEACDFMKNHAFFHARGMGTDRLVDLMAYDALLHEGAHMELQRHWDFPAVFHELFAYSLSLANAKAPHFLLSSILNAYAYLHKSVEHNAAAWSLFLMINPLLAREGDHFRGFPRMIAGFASRSPEEIREAAQKVLSRICARHSIGVGSMQEKIVRDTEKAVFG